MDKKYLDLLDSVQAAANLALAITVNCHDQNKKEIADCHIEYLLKEVMRTRVELCWVLELQQNEVHHDYRYPRVPADLPK